MNIFKWLFSSYKKNETVVINILGKEYIIDLSNEATKERAAEFELLKKKSWKSKGSKRRSLNSYEQTIIGNTGLINFSESGEYAVAYLSAGNDSMKGYISLIHTPREKVLFSIDAIRPHDCKVSNNGFIACNDWGKVANSKGKFLIYDVNGEIHYKRSINENIGDLCLITPDGSLAVYDTLSTNSLRVIDVKNKKQLKSFDKYSTNVMRAEFEGKTIIFEYNSPKRNLKIINE
ncbi:hypothetical protein [Flavobacterium kingsejongi]|uniref:Uncharacterized protein n=1 Tax=Flavobacterium kingsejongi TaxID=1678728 RepID=A0A2S1LMZ8_9FLAO|nr:hypothetical protein [Flavobacterium kingsejongi]AWG24813.1 hypothetical protein FK004_06010 [Flavobacterium kingsejongi]AWG25041.1 hypothetical protein FK004_07245 [Flavobacterium kingsejongi]